MDYISIRVSTLRGDQKIDFDAYIKINDKWILYLRHGDSFEGPRLERLKSKKLRKMYILKDEERNYLDYLQKNIDSAYDMTNNKDMASRAEIIQGSQESNAESVFENPESAENYNKAKEEAGRYIQFLMSTTESVKALLSIENSDQSIAHHGVNVSTFAVSLARKLGITDEKKIQLMSLGALLHDFGHNLHPVDLGLPLNQMTEANYAQWKMHPKLGAESVQDKKHFDLTVLNIIMQHEEKSNGSGPLGMVEKNQDPLATIVASANTVDRLMSFEKVPKDELSKKLMMDYLSAHPLNHLKALTEIIKTI